MLAEKVIVRRFLPAVLKIESWDSIKFYADDLLQRPLGDLAAYQRFLDDASEFDDVLSEEAAWRYIRMSCNTADEAIKKSYDDFLEQIQPEAIRYDEAIARRIVESEFASQVKERGFSMLLQSLRNDMELFREENVERATEIAQKSVESEQIKGAMTVEWEGHVRTLPEIEDILVQSDRDAREKAWRAIRTRHLQDAPVLDKLFDEMAALRQQSARHAGFNNYRDYMFRSLNRNDYTPQDSLCFHEAIGKTVVPLVDEVHTQQKQMLGVDVLRPWDIDCDPLGRPSLKAFKDADDLIAKGAQALAKVDPQFRDVLELMYKKKQIDLDSRPNKAPGGYNYMLEETGLSFMFGNITQKPDDIVLLMHEMGHAVHDVIQHPLRLHAYRQVPTEMAELASSSLELLTHDSWRVFFPNDEDCRRARLDHLQKILKWFPWMAMIDAFQHQVYTNPDWTIADRHAAWLRLSDKYQGNVVNWSGLENERRYFWHKQVHVFSMPFYYIEYGISQLGAFQIWRNYRQDKKQALAQYKAALALGNTASLPELYKTAGIRFDFSTELLSDMMQFLKHEMDALR